MSLTLKARNAKGDCDCCPNTDVMLTPSKHDTSMMMCPSCVAQEAEATATVARAEKVITESRENDSKITLKEDVMTAITTSFIELHGAILANPAVPAESKRFALANEVSTRIDSLQTAIFAKKAELAALENEAFAWRKNLQPLVSTLQSVEQEKFKKYNMNYKPVEPTIKKVTKVAKAGKVPVASSKRVGHKAIKEACDAAGVDIIIVSNMMLSPKNAGMTVQQVISKYLEKSKNL